MSKRGRSNDDGLFGTVRPKKPEASRVAKTRSAYAGPSKSIVDAGARRKLLQARIDALEASNSTDDATLARTGDELHPLSDFISLNATGAKRAGRAGGADAAFGTAKKGGAVGARPGGAGGSRISAPLPLLQIIAAETGQLPPQLAIALGGSGDAAAFTNTRGVISDDARGADGQLLDTGHPARDYLAAAVGPGTLPPRPLCAVCGFSASAGGSCTRCSARCCSAKCIAQHTQTRCFR